LDDSVAVDAKRILLRYGAPIALLDRVDEKERIELARLVSRTPVPDRGYALQDLLVERGYLDEEEVTAARGRAKGRKKPRKK
jgi:hypothetical protein